MSTPDNPNAGTNITVAPPSGVGSSGRTEKRPDIPSNREQKTGEQIVDEIKQDIINMFSESITYETENMLKEEEISGKNYVNISTYKLNSQYNFYTDFFESTIKNTELVNERMLPNMYVLTDKKFSSTTLYEMINTLNNTLDIDPEGINNEYEYFDQYSQRAIESLSDQAQNTRDNLRRKQTLSELNFFYSNLHISNSHIKRQKELNENQFLMPFYNKINIKTDSFGVLSGLISNLNDDIVFNTYLKNLFRSTNISTEDIAVFIDQTIKEGDEYRLEQTLTTERVNIKRFANQAELLSSLKNLFSLSLLNINNFYLGSLDDATNTDPRIARSIRQDQTLSQLIRNNQKTNFRRALNFKIFSKRFNDYFENNKPTINEILTQIPTEILGYQLVKSSAEPGSQSQAIQEFYFLQNPEIQEMEYIDSQVKYGKQYRYDLYSYNFGIEGRLNMDLINGLSYQEWGEVFTVLGEDPDSTFRKYLSAIRNYEDIPKEILVKYISEILKILEDWGGQPIIYTPIIFRRLLFSDVMAVFDNPPPPPEVQIDGMIGIDNKLFIRLNSSISEFKAKPILIQADDEQRYLKNVINQKLEDLQSEMMFDGDDRIDYFQIFKLDFHPKNYTDFRDKFVEASTTYKPQSSTTNYEICDVLKANHSSYVDAVSANKKYYYMFRSVDIHGNISNPSPIYEVQIVNAEGTIFTLIKIVDLLKDDDKQPSKPAKRFLYISPNAVQTLIDERASGYFTETNDLKDSAENVSRSIVLGLTEDKIWNKNYRLKIRSKTTGKIIEIDFKFTHEALSKKVVCE